MQDYSVLRIEPTNDNYVNARRDEETRSEQVQRQLRIQNRHDLSHGGDDGDDAEQYLNILRRQRRQAVERSPFTPHGEFRPREGQNAQITAML